MIPLSFTVNVQLRSVLLEIDELRTRILTLPMLPKTEQKLAWEAMAIRVWATLALSGHTIPKQEVATILAHPIKPTNSIKTIYAIRDNYRHIHVTHKSVVTMPREILAYLDTETEHPVIQAALAHAVIQNGITARLAHYYFLAKFGYDIRGYAAPERAWQHDEVTYHKLIQANTTAPNLNIWLAFIAQSMRDHLAHLYEDIRSARTHIEFPAAFWELSDRQKEIMKYLLAPHATITNRMATKRFGTSHITASRDLSRLVSLGLIYPHSKGRAVYYTKI